MPWLASNIFFSRAFRIYTTYLFLVVTLYTLIISAVDLFEGPITLDGTLAAAASSFMIVHQLLPYVKIVCNSSYRG